MVPLSGCSNEYEKYEKELPNILIELIDSGWTVKEAHTDERIAELNTHWAENLV